MPHKRGGYHFAEEHPYPILQLNFEGKILYANPSSLPVLLEWDCEVGQVVPLEIKESIKKILLENIAQKIEIQHGKVVIELTLFQSANKNLINVFGQDITIQKINQEEAEFYKKALDQTAIVARTDKFGVIESVNENFCKISGYEKEELIGKTHKIVNSGVMNKDFFGQMWRSISSGSVWRGEICNKAKDGNLYWVDTSIIPFMDANGVPEKYVAIRSDITQKKKTDSELIRAKQRLEEAEKVGRFGSWEWDLKNKQFLCSKGLYSIFEWSDDVKPDYEHFLQQTLPTDRNALEQAMEESIVSKQDFVCNYRIRLGQDRLRWIRSEGHPVCDEKMKVKKLTGIVQDVTEKIQNEIELTEATLKADSATRTKAEFLANMSHEIRTPMNGVIGMCSLLMDSIHDPVQKEQLKVIYNSGNSLLNLINDILDFSKVEAGKIELEKEPFDIHSVTDEVLKLLKGKADEKKISLSYHREASVPAWVVGDSTRFRQVITNLIGNAIKFTNQGGVSVFSKARLLEGDSYELHFSVKDTGIGIPEGARKKLFSSFSQADVSTTRRFGGTGLGLAICKGLCEKMGGKIWFETEEGKGSVFHFTLLLPRCEAKIEIQKDEKLEVYDSSMGARHPLRILVAEDNRINQLIIAGMLEKFGYFPDVVENGIETLKNVEERDYDLIFMDYHMPEMDGIETTRKINLFYSKRATRRQKPVIVALTASAMKEDVDRCLEAGMTDFLSKPLQLKELIRILSELTQVKKDKTSESSSSNVGVIINTFAFDSVALLENYSGLEDILIETIDGFLKLKEELLKKIEISIQKKDAKGLEISAHTVKGVVSNFFAQEPVKLASQLEKMGHDGIFDGTDAVFFNLSKSVDQLSEALKEFQLKRKAA